MVVYYRWSEFFINRSKLEALRFRSILFCLGTRMKFTPMLLAVMAIMMVMMSEANPKPKTFLIEPADEGFILL